LKELELKLVSELMKNSRRSDRELAKILGVSQPTVSRMVKKLEEQGVIKEYTMIPDFTKLGFEIMSIDFVTLKEPFSEEKLMEIRKQARQTLREGTISAIFAMRGSGYNADRAVVAFHEDYSTYVEYLNKLKQIPLVVVDQIGSFLISLDDKNQYLSLTLSNLGDYITHKKRQESEGES